MEGLYATLSQTPQWSNPGSSNCLVAAPCTEDSGCGLNELYYGHQLEDKIYIN